MNPAELPDLSEFPWAAMALAVWPFWLAALVTVGMGLYRLWCDR